jgi:hypothetical protein
MRLQCHAQNCQVCRTHPSDPLLGPGAFRIPFPNFLPRIFYQPAPMMWELDLNRHCDYTLLQAYEQMANKISTNDCAACWQSQNHAQSNCKYGAFGWKAVQSHTLWTEISQQRPKNDKLACNTSCHLEQSISSHADRNLVSIVQNQHQ